MLLGVGEIMTSQSCMTGTIKTSYMHTSLSTNCIISTSHYTLFGGSAWLKLTNRVELRYLDGEEEGHVYIR